MVNSGPERINKDKKNKLYVKRFKGGNTEDKCEQYRIEKIIENLKESSCGWDELRPRIMKYIKQSINIPLTHISNFSFQTGLFPAELQIANVVPIFKSGDETIFTNYRPISVLPVFF